MDDKDKRKLEFPERQSNQILTDEEVKEGLVLSCQAIAQTEQISLDYDDV